MVPLNTKAKIEILERVRGLDFCNSPKIEVLGLKELFSKYSEL